MSARIVAIVGAVLLIVSLVGVGLSFANPLEKTVKQPVKLLEYEQTGTFNYQVTSRSSFFYDGIAARTSDPIPVSAIQSFDINFSYTSNASSGGAVNVSVILENTGVWKKTVAIPTNNGTGARGVSFALDLKAFQGIADAINKEIGSGGSSLDFTIQAVVPGGTTSIDGQSADFVQLLPVKMTRTLVRIGDSLDYTQGGTTGRFDYQVKLGENSLYGPTTISTPPAAFNAAVMLGPKDTIFVKLIDSMKVDFSYRLTADKPLGQVDTEVKIEAIAASPEKWSKTYILLPATQKGNEFIVSVPLDLTQFTSIFDTIQQESGVAASNEELTLLATVHAVAQTEQGTIDKTYTRSIKTNLRDGVMTWAGDLTKSEPGSIDTVRVVVEPARLWGRSVAQIRIISVAVACIMLVFLGFYVRMYRNRRTDKAAQIAKFAAEIDRKYKAMVVEVQNAPERRYGESILPVASVEDLMKVGQGLLKPVHHAAAEGKHIYWVYDNSMRYEYRLANGKVPHPEETLEPPPLN